MQNRRANPRQPDTFICHASEDKESMARPLHRALTDLRLHAWLDESDIPWGESIRQNIDTGLSSCRSATVVLSRIFFSKYWTQYELDGVFQRKMRDGLPFFPIQHGITIEEIRNYSPSLAGINLLNSNEYTVEQIAQFMLERLGSPQIQGQKAPVVPDVTPLNVGPNFGVFYIAAAGTLALPDTEEPRQDALSLFGESTGWVGMVDSNEELEYVIEGNTVRVRLDWGNQWSGSEYQAARMVSEDKPVALMIRRGGKLQNYLPSLVSLSKGSLFSGSPNRSGWLTFNIE